MNREEILAKIRELNAIKAKAVDADALVSELEKVRDKLPKEAVAALDKHTKKKDGKKQ